MVVGNLVPLRGVEDRIKSFRKLIQPFLWNKYSIVRWEGLLVWSPYEISDRCKFGWAADEESERLTDQIGPYRKGALSWERHSAVGLRVQNEIPNKPNFLLRWFS
jgi:hypothetical protein